MLWSRIIAESNTGPADARIQTVRSSGDHDQRHRARREDSETSVQDGKVARQTQHCSGDLGGYSRRLTGSPLGFDGDYTLLQNLHQSHSNSVDPQLARIEAATKFWAAGVQASSLGRLLAKAANVEVDRAGRVKVQSDCTLPGHPEVFVIGDLMSLDNLPGLAQVAIQSGRHAAETIVRRISGDTTQRPFRYRDRGTLATISRLRAIAAIGPLRVWGFAAWLLWLVIHLGALTGFKNRLSVLLNWTIAFLGHGRAQRVITAQQVFARQALEKQAVITSAAVHH